MWQRRGIVRPAIGIAMACMAICCAAPLVFAQSVQAQDELNTTAVRTEESNLANVVADALRAAGKSDIALIAAVSFNETTIAKGSVTIDDVLKALVFKGDTIAVLRLSGEQVRKALEHGLGLYPAKSAAFLQVSGLSLTVNARAERNNRVETVKVGKDLLDPARMYTVTMPSPLAAGALLYSRAWSRHDIERESRTTLEEALRAHLADTPTLSAKTGDRIAFRK